MIANYTNHAANERTFLAWLRTGLAVTAFGFFLAKLNVFLDAVAGPRLPHLATRGAAAVVAAPLLFGRRLSRPAALRMAR